MNHFNKGEFEFGLSWNDSKKIATVTGGLKSTIIGDPRSGIKESLDFVSGVNGTYIQNNRMYITEEGITKFMRTYGDIIDPPLEVIEADYLQVAVNATMLHFGVIRPLQNSATVKTPDVKVLNSHVDSNKLNHVFGKPGHGLGGLLKTFGGNQSQAYNAIQSAGQNYVNTNKITGIINASNEITLNVSGYNVTMRGIVQNGTFKLGTAFIKN